MAGKFLQIWSLRTVSKTMALLIIIALAVAIYATRGMPENFEEDEEWKFWRNLDFAVCVISLAFASVLLYGSIAEFVLFILAWMIWNVVLIIFWNVFLIIKHDELVQWERTFRIAAIVLMVIAEIPVFKYVRFLRVKDKGSESGNSWMETQSDKVYKTPSKNASFSSVDSMFVDTTRGRKNPGFQSDSPRSSVISVASEEIEGKSEKDEVEKEDEKKTAEKNEYGKVENEEGNENSDGQSQSSFEISVTVHTPNESDETANATVDVRGSGAVIENSNVSEIEDVRMTSEVHLRTIEVSEALPDETDDTRADEVSEHLQTDSRVVVDVEENDTRSAHLEKSAVVEIDVTHMHAYIE